MNSGEIRPRLDRLHLERLEAESVGETSNHADVRDLEREISDCRAALVGARVTELAIARAELHGALVG
jgi:hypothetical protein